MGELEAVLGPALSAALQDKGYDELTAVQLAVLDPALRGRDLRITSQTGSGKTLAIGFALREWVQDLPPGHKPRALIVAPTRELAQQTQAELQWLYAKLSVRVITTTGGTGYRDELRALQRNPTVIVGTPGRLLDHLGRGAFDATELKAIVLDEADRMLDLGFREDLEAIFKHLPTDRRTHLVTATLPRQLRALADKVQRDAAHVEGTRLGAANEDIDHVVHVIEPRASANAIINLLLSEPDAQTLIFARTRVAVGELAQLLSEAGFAVASLSGELEQAARNRALSAFKERRLQVLVATDVAARGIDVQDIARVIHAEPPTNADAYTHRSGRTGRAGKRGISSLLVTPAGVVQATRILRQAGVPHRFEPIPTAAQLRKQHDQRVLEQLMREPSEDKPEPADADPRLQALATSLLAAGQPERVIARLLSRARVGGVTEPREIRAPQPPTRARDGGRNERNDSRYDTRRDGPREREPRRDGPAEREPRPGPRAGGRDRGAQSAEQGYTRFFVTWGGRQGADPHRLLAILCRRGNVRSRDIGAIVVDANFSLVDVAADLAPAFAQAVQRPDPRDPHVRVRLDRGGAPPAERPELAGRPQPAERPRSGGRPPPPARPQPAGPAAERAGGRGALKRPKKHAART